MPTADCEGQVTEWFRNKDPIRYEELLERMRNENLFLDRNCRRPKSPIMLMKETNKHDSTVDSIGTELGELSMDAV